MSYSDLGLPDIVSTRSKLAPKKLIKIDQLPSRVRDPSSTECGQSPRTVSYCTCGDDDRILCKFQPVEIQASTSPR